LIDKENVYFLFVTSAPRGLPPAHPIELLRATLVGDYSQITRGKMAETNQWMTTVTQMVTFSAFNPVWRIADSGLYSEI